jgi:NADP-dependent 3-hydroxy acid dehydrogenase YdfG
MDIQDKIAVVTGAGKGIGRAISEMLIKRGAFVVLVARRIQVLNEWQSELDPNKASSLVISTDISNEKQVIDLFARIRGELGPVQILINNAGVGTIAPTGVESYETAEMDRILNINLKGAFFCARETLRSMRSKKSGTIINIVSIAGIKAAPNVLPYNVSKFGMRALGQTLLAENLKHGIKVHNICPGVTNTSIWDAKEIPLSEAEREKMLKPEDIASVAEFLLTLPQNVRIDELVVLPNRFPVKLWDFELLENSEE